MNIQRDERERALQSIASMIDRSEKAQSKFAPSTSQHTLQKNRIHALYVALTLVKQESVRSNDIREYTKEDFEKARAPIASLINKSEKVRQKLAQGTWQHTMLDNNLKALHMASQLLTTVLSTV